MAVQFVDQRIVVDAGVVAEPMEVAIDGQVEADRAIEDEAVDYHAISRAGLVIALGRTIPQDRLSSDGNAVMNGQHLPARSFAHRRRNPIAVGVARARLCRSSGWRRDVGAQAELAEIAPGRSSCITRRHAVSLAMIWYALISVCRPSRNQLSNSLTCWGVRCSGRRITG